MIRLLRLFFRTKWAREQVRAGKVIYLAPPADTSDRDGVS